MAPKKGQTTPYIAASDQKSQLRRIPIPVTITGKAIETVFLSKILHIWVESSTCEAHDGLPRNAALR